MIQEFRQLGLFVIALFSGASIQASLDAFLRRFIDEIKNILDLEHGIMVSGKTLKWKLEAFLCDALA